MSSENQLSAALQPIELRPHDPSWPHRAGEEARRLAELLGSNLLCIEHIGSTAISTIAAKPIVDLLPIVTTIADVDLCDEAFRERGYRWWGEYGIDGRRFLTWPADGSRQFNIHVFERGSPHLARHLAFRDYLREHPQEAEAYEAEKRRAAKLQPYDVNAYNDVKSDWIAACQTRALAWWQPTAEVQQLLPSLDA